MTGESIRQPARQAARWLVASTVLGAGLGFVGAVMAGPGDDRVLLFVWGSTFGIGLLGAFLAAGALGRGLESTAVAKGSAVVTGALVAILVPVSFLLGGGTVGPASFTDLWNPTSSALLPAGLVGGILGLLAPTDSG